jgi:hypothetical protein
VTLALVESNSDETPRPERLKLVPNEPDRIESEQAQHEPIDRYYDAVGRPRKLAAGAMHAMQREFRKGKFTTKQLAERYGVSVSLVLTICYHTPKGTGLRPAPEQQRPVVVSNDD